MKKQDIVSRIPGGLYGNNPGSLIDPTTGNVAIASGQLDAALRWLLRRSTVTSITTVSGHTDTDTLISYRLKLS